MLLRALQAISNAWRKLSQRERRLAALVGLLLPLFLVAFIVRSAMMQVSELDTTISRLQDDVLSYTHLMALKRSVESQYEKVAAQHSSEWTAPEIQDRLRQEIYRLSKRVPPPLDDNGIPVQTESSDIELVRIPALQQGTLRAGAKEYREYLLDFQIPSAKFSNIVDFIERLQNSPQSLRVDALELVRDPSSDNCSANIGITRTIASGAQLDEEETQSAGKENDEMDRANWTCKGAELSRNLLCSQRGKQSLGGTVREADAELAMIRSLPARRAFDLYLDITVSGKGTVAVSGLGGAGFSGTPADLTPDNQPYRVHLQFTVPGEEGTRTRVKVPCIQLAEPGSSVEIRNVVLREAMG